MIYILLLVAVLAAVYFGAGSKIRAVEHTAVDRVRPLFNKLRVMFSGKPPTLPPVV
jgi:hypothetical protein